MSKKLVDVKQFAERVERMCDFFISKADRDGSDDIRVFQDLKEDAADLQFQSDEKTTTTETINGLSDFMKGA